MTEEYKDSFTRNWNLLKNTNEVELYQYFDTLDWEHKYAIKYSDKLASIDSSLNPYSVFDLLVELSG